MKNLNGGTIMGYAGNIAHTAKGAIGVPVAEHKVPLRDGSLPTSLESSASWRWRRLEDVAETEPVVLVIDDDPNNLGIMSDFLKDFNYTVLAAEDGETGLKRAAYAQPDLILLDLMMPGIDGYETCRRLKAQESTRDIPIICMTALAETEYKLKGFQAGVVDYVTKPYQREEVLARIDLHLSLRKATRELQKAKALLEVRVQERTCQLESANRKLEREIAQHRETERKFQAIFDNAFQHMGLMTPDGAMVACNRTSLAFGRIEEPDVVNRLFWELPWWDADGKLREQLKEAVAQAARGDLVRFEFTNRGPDQNVHHFDFSIKPVQDEQGRVVLLIPEARDITDRIKLAEQLRQSQKLEAIGTLAGGVAHDFNNILTAIIGFGTLLGVTLSDDTAKDYLHQILSAADRATNLTNSLLAFSRKEVVALSPVRLNEVVKRIQKLLWRLIGEDIEFRAELDAEELVITSDAGQIEQILMNLAVNSRDAMPSGGNLVVKTERIEVSDPGSVLEPGRYAVLSVTDTGEGMDDSTRQRIFEPFFTTKEVGKGTGLGLSIVYGIVQQHNGHIEVHSEVGVGTTFRIFLKLVDRDVEKRAASRSLSPVGGTETILVAEDDGEVRRFMAQTLSAYGYTIIEAGNGEEAVREYKTREHEIDLVILDVVMPKANGKEVYQQIAQSEKRVPVIFCSGYTSDIIDRKGITQAGSSFISKPMTPYDLLSKVRVSLSKGGQP